MAAELLGGPCAGWGRSWGGRDVVRIGLRRSGRLGTQGGSDGGRSARGRVRGRGERL